MHLKGEVRRIFYRLKVCIGPKLREVTISNFHRKAPKWVKNQAKGSKIHEKTPSKKDVAPWDKHWIKREFNGFGLYSMVFVEIHWYSMVFIEIQWSS